MFKKIIFVLFCIVLTGTFGFDVSEDTVNSVVLVNYYLNNEANDKEVMMSGSGVILESSKDELVIVSNRHVADCAYARTGGCLPSEFSERVEVMTRDKVFYDVSEVHYARDNVDLVILKVTEANTSLDDYPSAKVSNDFENGDDIVAIGYPGYAYDLSSFEVESGKITRVEEKIVRSNGFTFDVIEHDAFIYFGSSGGGVFNKEGDLIGINTWGDSENDKDRKDNEGSAIVMSYFDIEDFIYCDFGSVPKRNVCELR